MGKTKNHRKNSNRIKQRRLTKSHGTESVSKEPHCLILTRGSVSMDLKKLSKEFQKILEPNVPARLKGTRNNAIKDFVAVSSQLSLTHIVAFSQTSLGMYVKFCRIPQGPTVTFKILNYTMAHDVLSSLKKHYTHEKYFLFSPCVMTNIETKKGDLQLQVTARMFLDMFPNISPTTASTNNIRRCCLFNYDAEKDQFDLRHYCIRTVPVDVCKGLKKMLGTKVPNLGKFKDVSEYITKSALLSDSEGEDDPEARIAVPQKKVKGMSMRSSVRLTEIGPRMTLQIYKVENGLLGGQVLYHSHVIKSAEDKLKLEQLQRKKKKLKLRRKKIQEENVKAKEKKKEDHKKRCLDGMGLDKKEGNSKDNEDSEDNAIDADDEDDDAEYFRKEVGEEPDPDFFRKDRSRPEGVGNPKKKFKKAEVEENPRKKFRKAEIEGNPKKKFKKAGQENPKKKFKNDFREIKKAKKERKSRR